MATQDFRASQIQTNKIISSGSTGTNAKLLIYDIAADGSPTNQGNINTAVFSTSSIGNDIYAYFSGSESSKTCFGGGIVVSGSLSTKNLWIHTPNDGTTAPPVTVGSSYPGIYLGGYDSTSVSSGSLYVFNHTGNWASIYSNVVTPGVLTVDLFGSISHLTQYRGSAVYIIANSGAVWVTPSTDIYLNTPTSNNYIICGYNDASDNPAFPPTNATIRTATWGLSSGQKNATGTTLILQAGAGLGSDTDSKVRIMAAPTTSSYSNQKLRDVGVFWGRGQFQIPGNTLANRPGATSALTGSIFYETTSGTFAGCNDSKWSKFGLPTRQTIVGSYKTTTLESGSAEIAGQAYFDPTEHQNNSVVFRAVLSTNSSSAEAFVKLFNVTSNSFVEIGGTGVISMSVSSSVSTKIQSVELLTATNFYPTTAAIYEVHLYTSTGSFAANLGLIIK
jgi:hypothetical protein